MISVILPTMNEEGSIIQTIESVKSLNIPNYEILVVDKSKDRTPVIAEKEGARVINQTSTGKGNAMILGGQKAKGSIIIFLDADETYEIDKIPEMIEAINENEADVVRGIRLLKPGKNNKFFNFLGNKIFSLMASLLYGKTRDLLTGFLAMKRKDFLDLKLKSEGFEIETEIFIKSCKAKLRIKEIETNYTPRGGETKLHPIKDGWRITKMLLKYKLEK